MSEIRVATRYAKSLFDLADEKKILDDIEKDADFFARLSEKSKPFETMLRSPIITRDKKWKVINRIADKRLNPLTLSFIEIVLRKGREMLLTVIFRQFTAMYKEKKGIITASVTTAIPVHEDILKEVRETLEQKTESSIELKSSVDNSILGGFILKYEDKLLDASVSGKLRELRKQLLHQN